jgi:chromosomal replication initiation ATPase DnaA
MSSAALKHHDDVSEAKRNASIKRQDARFQAAMRRELVFLAAERGQVLRFKPRPRDVLAIEGSPEAPAKTAKMIVSEVCVKHRVTPSEIKSARRSTSVVRARHEACYRLSKETSLTLGQIGISLGGRDHTTVIHGMRKHAERLERGEL